MLPFFWPASSCLLVYILDPVFHYFFQNKRHLWPWGGHRAVFISPLSRPFTPGTAASDRFYGSGPAAWCNDHQPIASVAYYPRIQLS